LQKLVNESSYHFSGKTAQAKLGLKMRFHVQLENERNRLEACATKSSRRRTPPHQLFHILQVGQRPMIEYLRQS
jgi:hypothetical protein